jgi:predicted RNA-binding protein associated with RNAse of E/G family
MDTGYQWLYICNPSDPFCVTSQFNEKNKLVQWYIDVLANWHYDKEGFPYFDDLYLDVVASSIKSVEIQDANELDEALLKKDIHQTQYDFAWQTARTIVTAIEADRFEPIKMSQAWLELFQS